jgi:hypothetical protein
VEEVLVVILVTGVTVEALLLQLLVQVEVVAEAVRGHLALAAVVG